MKQLLISLILCAGTWICVLFAPIPLHAQSIQDHVDIENTSGEANADKDEEENEEKDKSHLFSYDPKIELEGLIMLDSFSADGVYGEDERRFRDTGVRRARLGLNALLNKDLRFEIAVETENEESEIDLQKAAVKVDITKSNTVELGLIKQPFGLENNISTRKIRSLERSMATNVFAPGRAHGLSWTYAPKAQFISLGVFSDPDDSNIREISGRLAFAPIRKKRTVVQFGLSTVYRDNDGQEYRIRDSGVLEQSDNFFRSGRYDTDEITTIGIEAGWLYGPLLLQSEWFRQNLSLTEEEDSADPVFSGGYIQIGYVFNAGRRKFKDSLFGSLDGDETEQVVELFAGAGVADTIFEDKGDEAEEIVVGLNYQINKHIRFSSQIQRVMTENDEGVKDQGDSAIVRLTLEL